MSEILKVSGMVLSAQPIGEQDKRLVIETTALGKISVFARSCRRPGNALTAAANPFVMGEFSLIVGRSSFSLAEANVMDYFRDLSQLIPGVYTGFYFLDFVDYYGRENIDGTDMLNLLYVSLKALLKADMPDMCVRRFFELRLMRQNGDFAPQKDRLSPELYNLCDYICRAPLGRLFLPKVSEEIFPELEALSDEMIRRVLDRPLRSKGIMEMFYS